MNTIARCAGDCEERQVYSRRRQPLRRRAGRTGRLLVRPTLRTIFIFCCSVAGVHTFVCPRERRLLAAIACLSMYEELFNHVILKEEQAFDANYCGVLSLCIPLIIVFCLIAIPAEDSPSNNAASVFHFRLFHFGKWVEVVIDDRCDSDTNRTVGVCIS